ARQAKPKGIAIPKPLTTTAAALAAPAAPQAAEAAATAEATAAPAPPQPPPPPTTESGFQINLAERPANETGAVPPPRRRKPNLTPWLVLAGSLVVLFISGVIGAAWLTSFGRQWTLAAEEDVSDNAAHDRAHDASRSLPAVAPTDEEFAAHEPLPIAGRGIPLGTMEFTPSEPPREPQPERPTPAPAGGPSADALAGAVASFRELTGLLDELGWYAETPEQYQGLQEFANLVTAVGELIESGQFTAAQVDQMDGVTTEALDKLNAAPVPGLEGIERVNRFAQTPAARERPGLFVFGTCVRRPAGFEGQKIDGQPLFAFRLIGTEEIVVAPATVSADAFREDAVFLLIGARQPGESIEIKKPGRDDGRINAPVVRLRYILGPVTEEPR
ncbi:MAG: hypothetical protein KDA41_22920, partial [Planctomycetales bacterium]|nr:hypothetical protein [Planctomycetales bacterium]